MPPLNFSDQQKQSWCELGSLVLAGLALWMVLKAGLVLALFSGLLIFSLIHRMEPLIAARFRHRQPRMLALIVLALILSTAIFAGSWGIHAFLRSDGGNLHTLLQKMADIIEASRSQVPDWLANNLPEDVAALQDLLIHWLREHAGEAKTLLPEAGHLLVHLILGVVIGAMVAVSRANPDQPAGPLAVALSERIANLATAFHKIVFAQVQISLINTVFSAIYLALVLPLLGIHLPLVKTMIAITFIAGLIPVAGNIISNTVVVIVALSHSVHVAAGSLLFMVLIHKAEYFLNARIIGAQINAKAWELLTAILIMETLFGLPGLVAAPVFYAYIKAELSQRALI